MQRQVHRAVVDVRRVNTQLSEQRAAVRVLRGRIQRKVLLHVRPVRKDITRRKERAAVPNVKKGMRVVGV